MTLSGSDTVFGYKLTRRERTVTPRPPDGDRRHVVYVQQQDVLRLLVREYVYDSSRQLVGLQVTSSLSALGPSASGEAIIT